MVGLFADRSQKLLGEHKYRYLFTGMEKLVLDEGAPKRYGTSKCPDRMFSDLVIDSGCGFIAGTTIGFFYNSIKGNSCGFKSRFCSALAKSPCIGGNFAMLSLGQNLSRAAYFKYSGEIPHTDVIPYQIPCAAIGGAVGFAHYGLRSALLGALMSTGMMVFTILHEVGRTRSSASICKTNTYTYPYYRHLRGDIPWIQDDSSLPED